MRMANYSFAAGRRARATNDGAFVWADNQGTLAFPSTANNEFSVRATGGSRFVSAIDGSGNPTAGVVLSPGAGAWAALSDATSKENITPVDGPRSIGKSSGPADCAMELESARREHSDTWDRWPRDFHAAFDLGTDPTRINTVDPDGVALAAIQGLHSLLEEQQRENEKLRQELADMKIRLNALASEMTTP